MSAILWNETDDMSAKVDGMLQYVNGLKTLSTGDCLDLSHEEFYALIRPLANALEQFYEEMFPYESPALKHLKQIPDEQKAEQCQG